MYHKKDLHPWDLSNKLRLKFPYDATTTTREQFIFFVGGGVVVRADDKVIEIKRT